MKLCIAAVGQRMPDWVNRAWQGYSKRFPPNISLILKEIPLPKRGKNHSVDALVREEADGLLAAVAPGHTVVALDERGRQWSTLELAERLETWMSEGLNVTFLIGGPDGLAREVLERANLRWSLGKLTLPHALARVVLVEQLYRAWTVTQNHPYHRP